MFCYVDKMVASDNQNKEDIAEGKRPKMNRKSKKKKGKRKKIKTKKNARQKKKSKKKSKKKIDERRQYYIKASDSADSNVCEENSFCFFKK